jgi:hypothetical protein
MEKTFTHTQTDVQREKKFTDIPRRMPRVYHGDAICRQTDRQRRMSIGNHGNLSVR